MKLRKHTPFVLKGLVNPLQLANLAVTLNPPLAISDPERAFWKAALYLEQAAKFIDATGSGDMSPDRFANVWSAKADGPFA